MALSHPGTLQARPRSEAAAPLRHLSLTASTDRRPLSMALARMEVLSPCRIISGNRVST